ncbi:DUF503 family protein [bacterium]|jgi:uncharacterized protein YlxP (DUF503 family)|nr:DUF503 family protein [bacterium]
MLIAVGRIVMDFYNNDQASVKRKKLDELCKNLRHQYNISVLEVAEFDDPEKCVIGFAAVIPETWKTHTAQRLIETICKTIDQTSFARVMVEDCDLLSHGEV